MSPAIYQEKNASDETQTQTSDRHTSEKKRALTCSRSHRFDGMISHSPQLKAFSS